MLVQNYKLLIFLQAMPHVFQVCLMIFAIL